ncbi:MAG: homocysteine S-methyltransferase family protein, partial [Anaerolineae bacterium]|nr:homocysteine S-methyltransferase family protein [Anaerolineae bacterium]
MQKNPWQIPLAHPRYLDAVADHVVLFDGATGTELAKFDLTAEDFGGKRTEGLWEMLVWHRPELVESLHAAYLAAGAEVIETDSFRANRITLQEFGIAERTLELNRAAATLARRVADRFQAETGIPRFVAGAMGPTGKLLSLDDPALSDVTFDELAEVYAEQAQGLIEGGVDVLLLETQQDLLELKAAIHGIGRTFRRLGMRLPLQAQVTLDASGHTLTGSDVEAALVTLAALPVDVIGLNCSTGPEEMREAVSRLLALSNRPVSVLPNAGMPENVDGRAVYRLGPERFAALMAEFVRRGARVVGGCCGTGPEHIAALAAQRFSVPASERLSESAPSLSRSFAFSPLPYVASNLHAVALHQEPRPLLVGERINTQGSRKAKRLVLEKRYESLLELAEAQVAYGAHVLDVCVALTERADEVETLRHIGRIEHQRRGRVERDQFDVVAQRLN